MLPGGRLTIPDYILLLLATNRDVWTGGRILRRGQPTAESGPVAVPGGLAEKFEMFEASEAAYPASPASPDAAVMSTTTVMSVTTAARAVARTSSGVLIDGSA